MKLHFKLRYGPVALFGGYPSVGNAWWFDVHETRGGKFLGRSSVEWSDTAKLVAKMIPVRYEPKHAQPTT